MHGSIASHATARLSGCQCSPGLSIHHHQRSVWRSIAAAAGNPAAASTTSPDTGPETCSAANHSIETEAEAVEIRYRGRLLRAVQGTKLRTALLQAGLTPHNGRAQLINCRGLGTCGTCAVQIRGQVHPPSWTATEQLRLNFPPHKTPNNQRLRLACQVSCQADLTVFKYNQFWGQGDERLGDVSAYDCVRPPLGQLEYLLDPQARTQQAEKAKDDAPQQQQQ